MTIVLLGGSKVSYLNAFVYISYLKLFRVAGWLADDKTSSVQLELGLSLAMRKERVREKMFAWQPFCNTPGQLIYFTLTNIGTYRADI